MCSLFYIYCIQTKILVWSQILAETRQVIRYFSSFVIKYAHFQISVSYNIKFIMFPNTNTDMFDPHEAHNLSSNTLSISYVLFLTVLSSFELPKNKDNIFFPLYIINTLKNQTKYNIPFEHEQKFSQSFYPVFRISC